MFLEERALRVCEVAGPEVFLQVVVSNICLFHVLCGTRTLILPILGWLVLGLEEIDLELMLSKIKDPFRVRSDLDLPLVFDQHILVNVFSKRNKRPRRCWT